jgi:hypothetical protein
MDLRAFKRLDEGVDAVLARAKHVALYKLRRLADGSEDWEREDVEGALFVLRRDSNPRYALCILNRLSASDFIETVSLPHCEFEFSDRFILFRKRADIRAIWVAQESEDDGSDGLEGCKRALEQITRELQASPQEALYVSKGAAAADPNEPLSRDELRDSIFRLLGNDTILDMLHAQFLATEARKSQQQQQQQQQLQQAMHPQQPVPYVASRMAGAGGYDQQQGAQSPAMHMPPSPGLPAQAMMMMMNARGPRPPVSPFVPYGAQQQLPHPQSQPRFF